MTRYYDERFPLPWPSRLRRELRLRRPPWWMLLFVILLILFGVIPMALILYSRMRLSDKPRIHFIQDMDVQPRFGPQARSVMFPDGRAMRLPPEGTVARGTFADDPSIPLGYSIRGDGVQRELIFLDEIPQSMRDDPRLLARGRERFGIYCATCHGDRGDGAGPIHERAVAAKEPKWVPPSDLLSKDVRERADGHIYNTIRNGIRAMPPHAEQIDVRDRWAIVAYVRELQRAARPAPERQAADARR